MQLLCRIYLFKLRQHVIVMVFQPIDNFRIVTRAIYKLYVEMLWCVPIFQLYALRVE